jgi:hypothetical protein
LRFLRGSVERIYASARMRAIRHHQLRIRQHRLLLRLLLQQQELRLLRL